MANEFGQVLEWQLMRRFDHGSGGVTVLVCEELRGKQRKKSKHEDDICCGCVEMERQKK